MKLYKTYKLNNLYKLVLFSITLVLLFIFSKQNFDSAKNTINIFLFSVMPSLFPFILFTEIILKTDIINILSKLFGKLVEKVFKVNSNSTSSIIIGFLCGYPMGAKAVISSYENKELNYNEASILLNFINNCNPIFIISTISLNLFGNITVGIILLISHLISALLLGIISSNKYNNNIIHENTVFLKSFEKKSLSNDKSSNNFFDIIKTSILNSFITLEIILGFMLIFNMLSNIFVTITKTLNLNYNIIQILTALFEVTGGCFNIGMLDLNIDIKICIISFMLGFSGLCIIFQIYSVIYKYKFSLKRLIIFKLLHGIFSFFITYILLNVININDITTLTTFSNNYKINTNNYFYSSLTLSYMSQILLFLSFSLVFYILKIKNKK